jgi:hypothetical protein
MKYLKLLFCAGFLLALSIAAFGQTAGTIKRTTHKSDRLPFGVGGTLAVLGAPNGSIRVEGWSNNEIEITAEIEIQAANEADLATLSKVTGFTLEETLGRTGIVSIGPNDKKAMKKFDKKFPKHLIGVPFRINYAIKVPRFTDLKIDGGVGDLHVSGVEGAFRINVLDGNSTLDLVGGHLTGTFGKGTVNITIPSRSWRGRFAEVNLATGDLNVNLPAGLNAEFDASILRTGKIENLFSSFKPRDRKGEFTEKSIIAKTGTGSIPLKFTVGDGNMKINEINKPS